jgi:8-oxo-dGTP pyrophosphatase MutT (NUDIX family)
VTHIERRAARVLLVDAADRVLLLHGLDPARPGHFWWFTPGGGLDAGETPAQGAARELFEETGLRIDPAALGSPVHDEVTEFSFDGRDYRQSQEFFLHRVDGWEVDTTGLDEEEQRTIIGHRWWSVADIRASAERFYPVDLDQVLTRAGER